MTADPSQTPDRRKKPRYDISPDFRLNAALALRGEATEASGGKWTTWPGTLVNMSAAGANIQVSLAAVAYPESQCRLMLSLGAFKQDIPGTIAHYVCSARYSVCGVTFDFSYASIEKAYQRVLEPVIIGATLAEYNAGTDNSGRHREEYRGKGNGTLVIWREAAGGPVTGFDFDMNRYGVGAEQAGGDAISIKSALKWRSTDISAGGGSGGSLPPAQEAEARLQFVLAASNLPKGVPADVRKFLRMVA